MTQTLHFDVSRGPMRTEYERVLHTVLRRGNLSPERKEGEFVDVSAYSEESLAAARRVWLSRMVSEHQSAAVLHRSCATAYGDWGKQRHEDDTVAYGHGTNFVMVDCAQVSQRPWAYPRGLSWTYDRFLCLRIPGVHRSNVPSAT